MFWGWQYIVYKGVMLGLLHFSRKKYIRKMILHFYSEYTPLFLYLYFQYNCFMFSLSLSITLFDYVQKVLMKVVAFVDIELVGFFLANSRYERSNER